MLLAVHGGKRVLVLERHYEVGGFTHTFRRPGYEWDVGLHYIGQVQDRTSGVRRAFDHVTANQVQWQAMPDIYDRVIIEGRTFDLSAGLERFREGLKQSFPSETRHIDRYIAAVQACNRASGLYHAEKAVPKPLAAVVGGLMRAPYMRWARRTTREVLESLTGNHELIGVLTAQWGDKGLPPAKSSFAVHATIAEHYFGGGSYPVGGASTIAAAIIPQIESNGGAVVSSRGGCHPRGRHKSRRRAYERWTRVSRSDGDKRCGCGQHLRATVAPDLPALDSLRNQLRRLQPSSAHLSLYVGQSQSDAALGLKGINLWIYPSFHHDANGERFAQHTDAPFPVVYISFPSAKDPDFQRRHPGRAPLRS